MSACVSKAARVKAVTRALIWKTWGHLLHKHTHCLRIFGCERLHLHSHCSPLLAPRCHADKLQEFTREHIKRPESSQPYQHFVIRLTGFTQEREWRSGFIYKVMIHKWWKPNVFTWPWAQQHITAAPIRCCHLWPDLHLLIITSECVNKFICAP